ncbi:MAG: hypothetical protein JWO53_1002 [Chlamydiia bacterium]|nr:hypothetical protein [Chlamydiia bacterium]
MFLAPFSKLRATPTSSQNEIRHLEKLVGAIREKDYELLHHLLKEGSITKQTLQKLSEAAAEQQWLKVLKAIEATTTFLNSKESNAQRIQFGLKRSDFLRIALFVEMDLTKHTHKGEKFLEKSATGLPCALEYDSKTKRVFIILDGYKNIYVGQGSNKIVTKAIFYKREGSEIIARAVQTKSRENEIRITTDLIDAPGIFHILACTNFKKGNDTYRVIYSKLYTSGTLHSVFHRNPKFTLLEKAKIALDILQGLEQLHKRKITHRDVAPRNCFVSMQVDERGIRTIKAVIADLGRSDYIWGPINKAKKVQGHTTYNPPEAIFRNKIHKEEYLQTDIFAAGCIFYQLLHETLASWQKKEYFYGHHSRNFQYLTYVAHLNKKNRWRKAELQKKKASRKISETEAFEYLILKMVDPDPTKRGKAGNLREEMQHVCSRIEERFKQKS